MKKILIPVDFSACSLNAIHYAIQLYRNEALELLLFNAYPLAQGLDIPEHYLHMKREDWEKQATAEFEEIKAKIEAAALKSDLTFSYILAPGSFVPELIYSAQQEKVDGIVMGTEGAQGLKKLIEGTHTSKVVTHVDCPVMVVPENYRFRGLHTLVYATDYHDQDVEALKQVVELARSSHARLLVLHIEPNPGSIRAVENLSWFEERIRPELDYELMYFEWLDEPNVQEALDNYLWDEQADMLVMLMKNRSWMDRVFYPSQTKAMTFRTQIPLWTFSLKALKSRKATSVKLQASNG